MRFTKAYFGFLSSLLAFGFSGHANASLLNFSFSFSSNPSPIQSQYLDVVPGTVTGLIEGLPDNGTNVAAQAVIIQTIPSGLINGSGQSLPIDATAWPNVTVNSFTTLNGQIVAASFSGGIQGGPLWLDLNNGNGNSDLELNGNSSTLVVNPGGFSALNFAQTNTPEPTSLTILVVGGLLLCSVRSTNLNLPADKRS